MGTSHGKMNIDPKTISTMTGKDGQDITFDIGEYGDDAYYLAKLLLDSRNQRRDHLWQLDPGTLQLKRRKEMIICSFIISFPISHF